jgi:hypothetical protein
MGDTLLEDFQYEDLNQVDVCKVICDNFINSSMIDAELVKPDMIVQLALKNYTHKIATCEIEVFFFIFFICLVLSRTGNTKFKNK